jgi:hypothetical protein
MSKVSVVSIALALVAIVIAFVALSKPAQIVIKETFGAQPGPDVFEHTSFNAAATFGGIRATSTNDTTATMLASDLKDVSMIAFTPEAQGITLTLPASTTLSNFAPKPGNVRTVALCNASTSPLGHFTVAFGTGLNAHLATSTLLITAEECATIDFIRSADSDIEVFFDNGF